MKFKTQTVGMVLLAVLASVMMLTAYGGQPAEAATPTPAPTAIPVPSATPVKIQADLPAPAAESTLLTGQISEPFTATTGLDTFSAYRLDFKANFDGTRQGLPTAGELAGELEMTRDPEAQHVSMVMSGDAFSQLSPLGKLEIYRVGGTFYLPNPQNGSWIGVPEMFIAGMLPEDAFSPEKNIDLPQTAVLQGEETVDGQETLRYTFGPADLGEAGADYDQVEGTIWVAKEGNYVVKYEATFIGQHKNLAAGSMQVMDEGTLIMMYQVSQVNEADLTIEAPAEAMGLNLGQLLFN